MVVSLLTALVMMVAAAATVAAATSIGVVVNGNPITSYDVEQRVRRLKLTTRGADLRKVAVEELILESLQLAEAKRVKISIDEAQVDAALADIATRVKLSPAQLGKALSENGVNPQTLRNRLRAQITWSRLIRARFNAQSTVSEPDLVAALLKKGDEREIETTQFDLHEVTIALPEKPDASRLRDAEHRAKALREEFTSCSQGVELARKTRETVIRPVGKRLTEDLPAPLVEMLQKVPVGRLSEPTRMHRGLVMYAVCDKKTMKSSAAAMLALEPDIRAQRGDVMSRQYLRTLHRDAIIEHR
jgi:peptidyl-prolyl cis-trans isomerase SurA